MTYSQKYCLVYFINPIAIGAEFAMTDWPLHVTLADVFAIELKGLGIESKLASLGESRSPVQVVADEEAELGTAHVVLLQKSPELVGLHNSIMDLLEDSRAVFNTPEFTRAGFIPHCTIQPSGRLHRCDRLTIDTLALVDMFPGGDWQRRRVIDLFAMGRPRERL